MKKRIKPRYPYSNRYKVGEMQGRDNRGYINTRGRSMATTTGIDERVPSLKRGKKAWATFRSEILTPQGYYALKVSEVFTKTVLHYAVWHDIAISLTKNITYVPMTADQAAAYNNLKTAFSAMEAAFK